MSGRSYPIVQYPYITVSLKSGFSLTHNYKDNRPDYFISLEHTRSSANNTANTATIKIQYTPVDEEDPNKLEYEITRSEGIIEFQYGIEDELSHKYIGFITQYNASVSEGTITYNIEVTSRTVLSNLMTISDESLSINVNSTSTVDDVLNNMDTVVNTYFKDYTFDKKGSSNDFKIPQASKIDATSLSPMTYLTQLASKLVSSSDENRYFYRIIVDDSVTKGSNKGTIKLERTEQSTDLEYTFEWGTKDTDVISWTPHYTGMAAVYNVRTELSNNSSNPPSNKTLYNEDGSIKGAEIDRINSDNSNNSVIDLTEGLSDAVSDINKFIDLANNYTYTAEITVLGLAGVKGNNLLPTKSCVKVLPLINGIAHHSQGVYTINTIKDSVSSSGFITTLDLYRYTDISKSSNNSEEE